MRKIISNTTPIISLLKINKLTLLRDLYQVIIVPHAVYQEVENGKEKPYYVDLKQIPWIGNVWPLNVFIPSKLSAHSGLHRSLLFEALPGYLYP